MGILSKPGNVIFCALRITGINLRSTLCRYHRLIFIFYAVSQWFLYLFRLLLNSQLVYKRNVVDCFYQKIYPELAVFGFQGANGIV